MFWQFENGTLLNLNILEDIGFFHDAETGLSHVRGRRRNGRKPHIDLFSSKDVEHVKMALNKIANALEYNELLVRETIVRSR